jgi:hypothetical protein
MMNPSTGFQTADNSILDINGRQTYLGNHFALPVVRVSLTGSSETNIALLQNPSTNSKSMFINLRRVSSTTQLCQFQFYIGSTFSVAGTLVTPVNLRTGSATTSISTCTTGPTTSAKGTLIESLECPTDDYVTTDSDLLIILDPGKNILITATPASDTKVNINLAWFEI